MLIAIRPGQPRSGIDRGRFRPQTGRGSHAGFEAPFFLALNEIAYRN